jgi:predicted RNA-binding Zn ribbon-like protein
MAKTTPRPFELVAGNIALDLVNTLDFRFRESGPEELLHSYADLVRFLAESGLLSETQVRKLKRARHSEAERIQVLQQVKLFRETVADIAYACLHTEKIPGEKLAALESYFSMANTRRQLRNTGAGLAWAWPDIDRNVAAPLWLLAHEAESLLLSDQVVRLRGCASETCQWLFLDTSKNHTRRWCDMKICGNRMKARRFQARLSGN